MGHRTPADLGEISRERSGRSVAALLLLILGLVAAANVGAERYLHARGTNRGYRIVHTKWALLESMTEPVDWLILGDSTGGHGVVPEIWAETFGGRAANLAVIANALVLNDAWMLERYIERFGPPKGVLMVHAHDIWARDGKMVLLGQVDRPWGFWARSGAPPKLSVDETKAVLLSRFLPLYAENGELKEHLWHWGQPRDPKLHFSSSGWIYGRGHLAKALRADRRRVRKHLRNTTGFRLSTRNRKALHRIGALASEHQFPVYLVNAPLSKSIAKLKSFQRYQRQLDTRLGRMAKVWKNLRYLPDLLTYPTKQMEGHTDHVLPSVAPRHTRRLAALVHEQVQRRRRRH